MKCHVCNNEDIENEFHFLCVCNAYIEFRNVLYINIYNVYHNSYNMTDKEKFVYLMEFRWKRSKGIFRNSMGEKNRYFI